MQKSSEPTWLEKFEEEYRKQWEEHTQRLEEAIWGNRTPRIFYDKWRKQFKQQHMTPIEFNDPRLIACLADLMEKETSYSAIGASDFVKNRFLPEIKKLGLRFFANDPCLKEEPSLTASLAPGQSTEEAYVKTGTGYQSSQYTTDGIKPFLMIDINAIKNKQYTIEEITQIFAQTGIQVLQKYPTRNMTFGQATEASQDGKKLARSNWNGKNMFMYYVPANHYISKTDVAIKEFGKFTQYNPYFAIKNVDGTVSTWVPSVNDCLAKDWYIVE
jgi:hypothetical protein